jgi:hypothetical protein
MAASAIDGPEAGAGGNTAVAEAARPLWNRPMGALSSWWELAGQWPAQRG